MNKKKIFILLPDGIGLRNFAYSKFNEIGKKAGYDAVYWNNTPFNLTALGFNEIKIKNAKTHPLTDVLKNSRKEIELNLNVKFFKDTVYNHYRFPYVYKNLKSTIKHVSSSFLSAFFSSTKALKIIRQQIKKYERKTAYYKSCIATLKNENPAMVFCTNQRPVLAIAPILAAQDLKIPTATFIFSWDNLPKATMVIETDYYYVWSELMKNELIKYYPYIKANQIIITGTPQFENHYDFSSLLNKEEFYKQYNLDFNKEYICFSGDDETTSPDDPNYLEDFAKAILSLNEKGKNLGIIFRRCPVDFSNRYKTIIEKYSTIIFEIAPKWKAIGTSWNTILPTKEDVLLLSNTIYHSKMVVNLGSSMVFDFITFNKPCGYFNYNQDIKKNINWDIFQCYKYVHFRSMPNNNAVAWFNSPEDIEIKIEKLFQNPEDILISANKWFEIINLTPPQNASERIWDAIKSNT